MQLRRLEVRNIRSYESGRVEFGPGTTLIVGDVGSGKTSLLYAIEMALFGVAEVDAPYLVRHGAPHAEVAVRFEDGDHRYDVSRRFRRIRRKGRESFESERITFREDGRETSYSATEVRQRVIELLGFPDNPNPQAHSDLWRWAIYVPQEKMREILSAKPQERLETIRKALGVERYRTAAENAQELSADLRGSARHRRESAERLAHHDLEFAEATEAADRLRGERVELERRIAATSVQQDAIRARVEELDRHAHQIQSDRREGESLEREQAADAAALADHGRLARERAAEVARRSAEREENRIHAERVDALRVALADADSRTRVAREELDRHGQEIRNLTTARAEVTAAERASSDSRARAERASHDREIARQEYERAAAEGPVKQPTAPVPQSVAELEARVVDARGRERGALERVAKAVSARAEIEELLAGGVCPRCHQSVRREEFEGHRTEISEEVRSAEESHRAILGEIERAEEERKSRERFERAHDRWAEVEKRREALREAQRRRESELHDTEAERAAADASREVARSRLAALEPLEQETVRRRRSLEESEAAQGRARDAAEQGSRAADRVRAADDALRALAAEIERAERELGTLERRSRDRAARLVVLREQLARGAAVAEAQQIARSDSAVLERRLSEERAGLVRADTRLDAEVRRIASAERGRAERASMIVEAADLERKAAWATGPFRLHLLAMEQELLAHAQATFDRAFQRFFASLVDDPALVARTDVGFTPEVMIDGEPTPAEALSGGERTALALAFRLALAQVVRSLGEVRLETLLLDEPTDGFSAEQVVRMGELLGELALPQVIIVSHEGQLASVADRTVRVRKVDGRAVLDTDRPEAPDSLIGTPPPRRARRESLPARADDGL